MSTANVLRMQESSLYAPDPARERATVSRQVNNEKGGGSSNGNYDSRNGAISGARDTQHQASQYLPYSPVPSSSGAQEAGSGDQERPRASPRPSGIGLGTYQALAHDPVYMAARTSPIGPPPRAALPALPPVPLGSSGPPPRDSLPEPPSQQPQQQRKSSGMLAMASESRPVTAVFNGDGDWGYPASSSEAKSNTAVHGGSEASSSTVSQQHRSYNSGGMATPQERGARSSTSASKQRRPEPDASTLPDNRAPSISRHARHGTDASSGSSAPGPSAAPTSSNAVDNGQHTEGPTDKMASKTVLTIALLEAQTAVGLDESDQAEAAIVSYSKSVELLQEVMRRVSETAGTYRRREMDRIAELKNARLDRWKQWRMEQYRRAGVQINAEELHITDEEIETREERRDREKRLARIAKRERMREEECAKLRVIHDTYAERVRALKEETAACDAQYAPSQANEDNRLAKSTEEIDTSHKLGGLSINGQADTNYQTSRRYTHTPIHSRHMGQQSVDTTLDSAARAGIGSAMLADSPISPTFHNPSASISASPPNRVLASAVPFPASAPSSQNNARLSHITSSSASPPSLALPEIHPFSFSPANSVRETSPSFNSQKKQSSPPIQQSILSFSPDSETSETTAFSDLQQSPGSRTSKTHRKNASSAASFNKTLPNPEGYATFGDLAAQASVRQRSPKPPNMPLHNEQDELSGPEGLATPTPDTEFSKAFAPHPQQVDRIPVPEAEASRSRAGSRASNALRHMTSNESMASTTTSSSVSMEHWNAPAPKMPLPPMPNAPQVAFISPPPGSENVGNRSSRIEVSRPLRSASLVAGQPPPTQSKQASTQRNGVSALASDSQRASALLINPSTLHGTISQRRKSPQMPDASSFPSAEEGHGDTLGVPQSEYQSMSGLGLTRTTSTERGISNRSSLLKAGGTSPGVPSSSGGSSGSKPFNIAGSLPMRLRALSQPSKRPGMSVYNSDFGSVAPPLPTPTLTALNLQRSDSDPSKTTPSSNDLPPTLSIPSTPMSFEYPGSLDERMNNNPSTVGHDDASSDQRVSPTGTFQGAAYSKSSSYQATSFLEPDTPASASFQQNAQLSPTKVAQIEYQPPPSDIMRVPFHFMRQIRASILSGAYLTPRLYIPKQLWSQSSMKLIHTETKVRMLDLLLNGLESIEKIAGDILLIDGKIKAGNVISKIDAANKLMRELESFEGILDGVQSTLAKKLPYIEQPNGKKGGGGSFVAWSSKLSRSMDRMTKGKNLDAPETYVAAIARLCLHAQILDRHLASLYADNSNAVTNGHISQEQRLATSPVPHTSSASSNTTVNTAGSKSGYNDIPADRRAYIEMRLKRTSDFFSKVICKMLLNDLGIWLDKYSKRAAGWTTD